MSRREENVYEFELDPDFTINSTYLDEFRRQQQKNANAPSATPSATPPATATENRLEYNPESSLEEDLKQYRQVSPDVRPTVRPEMNPADEPEDSLEDDFPDEDRGLTGGSDDEADFGKLSADRKTPPVGRWAAAVLVAVIAGVILLLQLFPLKTDRPLTDTPPAGSESGTAASDVPSPSDAIQSDTTETQPSAPVYRTLRLGSKGEDVRNMQLRLKELGYLQENSCTGYYGDYTQKIIKRFQKKAGLKATGVADPQTLERLYADDAPTYP